MRYLLALIVLCGLGTTALAQAPITVAPQRVEIGSNQRMATVTISNRSDKAREFSVTMQDIIMNASGSTETVDGFTYSAKRIIRVVPRRMVLQPNQRQTVRIMALKTPDLADGDYFTHMIVEEVQPKSNSIGEQLADGQGSFAAELQFSIGIPVTVSQGKTEYSLRFGAVDFLPPSEVGKNPSLNVELNRTGNAQALGYLTGVFTPANGKPFTVIPRIEQRVYRTVDAVTRPVALIIPEGMVMANGTLTLTLRQGLKESSKVLDEVKVQIP